MGITDETRKTVERFDSYIKRLIDLCKGYGIVGWKAPVLLLTQFRTNAEFANRWQSIWAEIAKAEGGKITLTTACTIIGFVVGGVGIATMGGAVGIPLALILTPIGYLAGQEIDSQSWLPWLWTRSRTEQPRAQNESKIAEELIQLAADIDSLREILGGFNFRCDALEHSLADLASIKGNITEVQSMLGELQSSMRTSNDRTARFESKARVLSQLLGLLAILWASSTLWLLLRR